MKEYWVYILRCADGSLYTGSTDDVAKRLAKHAAGEGARYTRGRGPFDLVYQAACPSWGAALSLEARIKRLPKAKKLRLIQEGKGP